MVVTGLMVSPRKITTETKHLSSFNVDKDYKNITAHSKFHRAGDSVICSKQEERPSLVLKCPQALVTVRIPSDLRVTPHLTHAHLPAHIFLDIHIMTPPNCPGNSGDKSSCSSVPDQINNSGIFSVYCELEERKVSFLGIPPFKPKVCFLQLERIGCC